MDINDLRSLLTVLTFICFIGIVWWAFSSRRKQTYEEAARMPLEDDPPAPVSGSDAGHAKN
jgi:cytochrome c oxidase cbb3-type subunit 4